MPGRIVALGGGGFSMEPKNPALDLLILSLARVSRPKVLFVGTASGDSLEYRLRFYESFTKHRCEPAHLDIFNFDRQTTLSETVRAADVIYVGGGNTPAMIAVWHWYGLPALLREALAGGSVLAGISAGANCWFERAVTDGVAGGGVVDGLGFAAGGYCPHYDGEGWRQPVVDAMVASGEPPTGYACEDSSGVVLDADGRLVEAVASVAGRQVRAWAAGRLAPIPTRLLV